MRDTDPFPVRAPDAALARLDAVGATAAFVCALHCAALPVLLATLPLAGLEVLASHALERVFVVVALLFGLAVIGSGYCTHRTKVVAACYVAAAVLMVNGAFLFPHGWTHAALLGLGGTLLGFAHAINRSGVRKHGCSRNLWADVLRSGSVA
jgi:hypothetical protein